MGNPEALLPKDSKDLAGGKTFYHSYFQDNRYRKYILNFFGLLAVSLFSVTLYRGYISSLDPGSFDICQVGALEHRGKPLGTHGPRNKPRRQNIEKLCPRVEPIYPEINTPGIRRAIAYLQSPDFLFRSAKTLGDAIKVRTAVYDDFGEVGRDDRWNKMERFHDYLHGAFPAVSRYLLVHPVNEYGLVYEWGGSNENLKPILLTAHQDVVPIEQETMEQWEHHPYSGHFDGNDVWGRGALDDKNQLVAIMETVNLLIQSGFRPVRKIVLAFGFDEEIGGDQGAHYIGEYLLYTYGEDGFSLIIDEGSSMQSEFGSDIMVISTAEKGFMNQEITIKMPGGHSSIPPLHSSIGIMSEIVVALESHPFERVLSDDNPLFDFLACSAAHARDFPKELYDYIVQDDKQALADALVKLNPRFDADLRSTTAVTTICGGTKVNALPEYILYRQLRRNMD
ncbi:hypothetical protein TWF191_007411 [Orbilia oligospora]|uniref:Uncharacterized protein n=1 Tax=Orbilia oligospora TaxID=2813651 RepID=A0A7C8V2N2_ORBOL|nr:hypothetical protein TWF191_007411 [Orbilia oligospora]